MINEDQADRDREWSRRVADIAVATVLVAQPPILALTPEQTVRVTEIIAEEIFIRLIIGDRPTQHMVL